MSKIRFPYPVETDYDSVSDGFGTELSEEINDGKFVNLSTRVLPIIRPEDFSGDSLAEKVIAANEFILNAGGGFELVFDQVPTYVITQAIVLPNNTTVRLDGCTLQLADNTYDNVFRTANIEIDSNAPYGFAKNKTSMEWARNIRIVGENSASVLVCDNTSQYGEANLGWRGHAFEFVGVQNFEICGLTINKNIAWTIALTGCCYGSVHDIEFHTTRNNGDGIDVEFGSHDIDIYNITGETSDDVIAVANSGPSRLVVRPGELNKPTTPFDYGWRKFGKETHNIRIYNVHAKTAADVVDIICGDYGIHHISIADISDNNGNDQGAVLACVVVFGGQYDGGYYHGLIHDVSINKVSAYDCGKAAIYLNQGIIKNCRINDVLLATGQTLLDNSSGVNPADYNFTITNTGSI